MLLLSYLLHSSLSIGSRQSSVPFMDDFFQSGLSLKELSSIFDTSPPCRLLKVITQQSVVSTSSPQICIVGASFKLSVSFEILSRRCFLSFSMSSVTGRRSGLLNFCLCSVARE